MRLVRIAVAFVFAALASGVASCQGDTNPAGTGEGGSIGSDSGVIASDAGSDQSGEPASTGSDSGSPSAADSRAESASTMNTCPSSCNNDNDCLACSRTLVFCCYSIASPRFCYQPNTGSCATSSMTDGGAPAGDAARGG